MLRVIVGVIWIAGAAFNLVVTWRIVRHRSSLRIVQSYRAAARTAVFFLEVLPMLSSRPVDWITAQPVIEQVSYPTLHGQATGVLYRPGTPGTHPGMVVCLGVVPFGIDHPQVPRLGKALARAGFAALLYWSPAMRDERLDPEDIGNIALAYQWLIGQPCIDADRSGLLGTCVGGSFALLAAADPGIRYRVAFVAAWAPYASMRTLARDVASATTSTDGRSATPWLVDPLTRNVYLRTLTAHLEPGEAGRPRALCAERAELPSPPDLTNEARATFPLLTALDVATAEGAIEGLPAHVRERLDAMSPVMSAGNIGAPLIVLAHDLDDVVIPVEESRRLVAALTGRAGVHFTKSAGPAARSSPLRRTPRRYHAAATTSLGRAASYTAASVPRFNEPPTGCHGGRRLGQKARPIRREPRLRSNGHCRPARSAPAQQWSWRTWRPAVRAG